MLRWMFGAMFDLRYDDQRLRGFLSSDVWIVVIVCRAGRRLGSQREFRPQTVAEDQGVIRTKIADIDQDLSTGQLEAFDRCEGVVLRNVIETSNQRYQIFSLHAEAGG